MAGNVRVDITPQSPFPKESASVKATLKAMPSAIFPTLQAPETADVMPLESRVLTKASTPLEPDALEKYGPKHANLLKLNQMTQGIAGVEVPPPFGIADGDVKKFLEIEAPQLSMQWKELGTLYAEYLAEQPKPTTPFLETHAAQKLVISMQSAIEAAFSDEAAIASFPNRAAIQEWLKGGQEFLMVRSTGAEDGSGVEGAKISNAGGNVSVSYVRPEIKSVLVAAGQVVASYFSPSSLQNRLFGKENPFKSPLKLAVTMQPLVGECVGGEHDHADIPISMVLFTNEPSYVGAKANANFRIMRISACFGHGEGVVGAQGVASDSILVLHSKRDPNEIYVVYDNQSKPTRLSPVKDGTNVELQLVRNPAELQQRPALDHGMIKRLFDLGIAVERAYAKETGGYLTPMDMELVVKKGKIYPVQARPVIRKEAMPTHIDPSLCAAGTIQGKIEAKIVLVPATSSALDLKSGDEVLIRERLEDAERDFDPQKHKLVIAGKEGALFKGNPLLSHPVVNFSGLGIPCLYFENLQEAKELVSKVGKGGNRLLVCLQAGSLYLWRPKGDETTPIKQGYTTHPAPLNLSMEGIDTQAPFLPSASKAPISQEVERALVALRAKETRKAALQALQQHPFLRSAEEQAKTLQGRIALLAHTPPDVALGARAVQQLAVSLKDTLTELALALSDDTGEELETLFYAKALEGLISQNPSQGISQLSLTTLPQMIAALDPAIDHQKRLGALPSQLSFATGAAKEALSPAVSTRWSQFLFSLELEAAKQPSSIEKELAQFRQLFLCLEKTGSRRMWINAFFGPLSAKCDDPKELLEQLLEGFDSDHFLNQVMSLKEAIEQEEGKLGEFADPKTFRKAFERLKTLQRQFLQKEFLDAFKKASPMEKLTYSKMMAELVTLFDSAIKSMKGCRSFSQKEKVPLFKEMLEPYFSLFEGSIHQLTEADDWPLIVQQFDRSERIIEGYLQTFKTIFEGLQTDDLSQLAPSLGFSVDASTLQAGTCFERHHPKTLEDCFTLIHQNLIGMNQLINQNIITKDAIASLGLPSAFYEGMAQIEALGGFEAIADRIHHTFPQPVLTHFDIHNTLVKAHYNIPQRNHSHAITLKHDYATGEYSLKLMYYGNERSRWADTAAYFEALQALGKLEIVGSFTLTPKLLEVELKMKDGAHLPEFLEEVKQTYIMSLKQSEDHGFYPERLYPQVRKELPENAADFVRKFLEQILIHKNPLLHRAEVDMYHQLLFSTWAEPKTLPLKAEEKIPLWLTMLERFEKLYDAELYRETGEKDYDDYTQELICKIRNAQYPFNFFFRFEKPDPKTALPWIEKMKDSKIDAIREFCIKLREYVDSSPK